MRLRVATLFIVALCLAVQACDSTSKQLVGKWRVEGASSEVVWEFQSNGVAVTSSGAPGRYTFGDNNRLKIQTPSATFVQQIELNGDRMTWRDASGGVTQLTRVK